MSNFLIAQIFGLLALVAYVISTQSNNRKTVLAWLTVYSSMYAIQYIVLGAFSGCISSLVPIVRNLVYRKYKNKVPTFWVIFFCILVFIAGIIFYNGPLSLLAIIHTIIYTIFIANNNLTYFRFIQAFSSTFMFTYNIYVGAYVGVVIVAAQFISAVVGIIRFDSAKIKRLFSNKRKI